MNEEKLSLIGLFVNLFLGFSKIIVGTIVKSSAIIADGIHSGVDVLSSGISYIGIKKAKKPADKEHPYGHYKAEVIAGLIITIILFITGFGIIYDAILEFGKGNIVGLTWLSGGVIIFSVFLNFITSQIKINYGKKNNVVSLISDGIHDRADVLSSIGVLIGLSLSKYFPYSDSVMAILIGLYIIKESFELGKDTTDSLLDKSAGEEIENQIKEIAKKQGIKIKELKTQQRGSNVFAHLKIVFPKEMKVKEVSTITKKLETKLISAIDVLDYVVIEIESHDFSENYYKGSFLGRGFGWRRTGKQNGKGIGPGGYCICENCNYKIPHEQGKPCYTIKCPKCGGKMKRENAKK